MGIFGPHCSWWMMGGWHLLPFQASWNALGSITGTIAKENLPSFLKVVRDAVSAAKTKERRRSKVGNFCIWIMRIKLTGIQNPSIFVFLCKCCESIAELRGCSRLKCVHKICVVGHSECQNFRTAGT